MKAVIVHVECIKHKNISDVKSGASLSGALINKIP